MVQKTDIIIWGYDCGCLSNMQSTIFYCQSDFLIKFPIVEKPKHHFPGFIFGHLKSEESPQLKVEI